MKADSTTTTTADNSEDKANAAVGNAASSDQAGILSSVSLGDSFESVIRTTKKSGGIGIGKPKPGIFVRSLRGVSEEFQINAYSIKEDDTGDIYILSRDIAEQVADEHLLRPRQFTVCVTSQGGLLLWPIALPVDGQLDEYNKSALLIVMKAETEWIRVVANRSVGCYEYYLAEGDLGEPEVPSMSMEEIVSIAFKDRVIDTIDHPVLKRLRGES